MYGSFPLYLKNRTKQKATSASQNIASSIRKNVSKLFSNDRYLVEYYYRVVAIQESITGYSSTRPCPVSQISLFIIPNVFSVPSGFFPYRNIHARVKSQSIFRKIHVTTATTTATRKSETMTVQALNDQSKELDELR